MYARNVHVIEFNTHTRNDPECIAEMNQNLQDGDAYILKNAYPKKDLIKMREYLAQIGRNSLPRYYSILQGCPNHHRVNRWDPRAYVKGCFHQFSFFPWNQDIFGLFDYFKEAYYLKNAISGLPHDKFLSHTPQDGCIARLSFQFYPKGIGALNKHADPVGDHQLTVTLLQLSKKGEDFHQGGSYVEKESGERIIIDEIAGLGDLIQVNATVYHGVETIDPNEPEDWMSFQGRWVLLLAVNALANNKNVKPAIDLQEVS